MNAVQNLIAQTGLIVKNFEKSHAITGQAFSFIQACNLLYNESIFHTRFLGYLLNPKAGHFQKDKFLKLFLKEFNIENEKISDFQVTVEKSIGKLDWDNVEGGRIDILIFNEKQKVGYGIEVKIFAGEQNKQLERYKNFINKKFDRNISKVFFLTLDGKKSGVHGNFEDYIPISFSNHILSWIEQCRLASIDQPVIRETLTQYISAIKTLTNQNPDNDMSDEIIKLITGDEYSFKAFEAINSTKDKLYQKFGENLIDSIKKNTDLGKTCEIEFTKRIIPNYEAEISFFLKGTSKERVKLFWLSKGVLAIGMQISGIIKPDDKIRKSMKVKLSNLFPGNDIDFPNWAWFSEIGELKNQPQLTFESWELFKSQGLAEKIMGWVVMVSEAYNEVIREQNENQ